MAKDEEEQRPRIVDRRMLSEEERKGTGPIIIGGGSAPAQNEDRPKLEVIGGGTAPEPEPEGTFPFAADTAQDGEFDGVNDLSEEEELSDEELVQLQQQMEEEQFAALEQQAGRPLTDAEKAQVRVMMQRQAESMSRLEVSPILVQTISDLARYATVHLGLVANPYTNLIARNDNEARLAIDAFGALYDLLKPKLDARVGAELARVLTDLRVNYTRITGAQVTPPGGPRIIR